MAASRTTDALQPVGEDGDHPTRGWLESSGEPHTATDIGPPVHDSDPITYALHVRESASGWALLHVETTPAAAALRVTQLLPERPNPFNPRTRIPFVLDSRQHVKVEIFDMQGRRVATLIDESRRGGKQSVVWDGTTAHGRTASSGVYVVRMQAGRVASSRKIVLLR